MKKLFALLLVFTMVIGIGAASVQAQEVVPDVVGDVWADDIFADGEPDSDAISAELQNYFLQLEALDEALVQLEEKYPADQLFESIDAEIAMLPDLFPVLECVDRYMDASLQLTKADMEILLGDTITDSWYTELQEQMELEKTLGLQQAAYLDAVVKNPEQFKQDWLAVSRIIDAMLACEEDLSEEYWNSLYPDVSIPEEPEWPEDEDWDTEADWDIDLDFDSAQITNAQAITLDNPVEIQISALKEMHFFEFVPDASGYYTLTAESVWGSVSVDDGDYYFSSDPIAALYGADGVCLFVNDDASSENYDAVVSYELEAGETYYFGVSSYYFDGVVDITVTLSAGEYVYDDIWDDIWIDDFIPDPETDWNLPDDLESVSVSGASAIALDQPQTVRIDAAKEMQFFKFTAQQDGDYSITTELDFLETDEFFIDLNYPILALFSEDGELLDYDVYSLYPTFAAGETYYIGVSEYVTYGDYLNEVYGCDKSDAFTVMLSMDEVVVTDPVVYTQYSDGSYSFLEVMDTMLGLKTLLHADYFDARYYIDAQNITENQYFNLLEIQSLSATLSPEILDFLNNFGFDTMLQDFAADIAIYEQANPDADPEPDLPQPDEPDVEQTESDTDLETLPNTTNGTAPSHSNTHQVATPDADHSDSPSTNSGTGISDMAMLCALSAMAVCILKKRRTK